MHEEVLVLIPLGIAWAVVMIVRAVAENSTRRKAIEKGVPEDVARTLFATTPHTGDQSLKYGLVAVALGLSLMVLDIRGLDLDRPLAFGIPLFFIGVALVGYHLFGDSLRRKDRKD